MTPRYQRLLILTILIVIAAAWIVWPRPEEAEVKIVLTALNFEKQIETRLGLDLVGGVQALLEADLPEETDVTPESMQTAVRIVENRVNALGVSEAVVQQAGDRRILVELPGETDPEKALEVLRQTGLLEFVDFSAIPAQEAFALVGLTIQTDFGQEGRAEVTEPISPTQTVLDQVFHTVMTGQSIRNVGVITDPAGQLQVSFELTPEGAQTFADFTSRNVGNVLAIVLDKQVISAPRIDSAITEGSGVITGNFDQESANALAVQLRYGSLPIPLRVVETRTVGPTLGQDSLQKSLIAGGVGFAIVILFMALYYRLPGVLADVSILIYVLIAFALFRYIPVTLTLPGIAGFLLSTGSALDANILIFERLKEELRAGRTLRQAIDLGWQRAWPSIRDSNIATLITCGILFWFGSQFGATIVKGFSLTLALGVAVSLFTALVVTRVLLTLVFSFFSPTDKVRWFGI